MARRTSRYVHGIVKRNLAAISLTDRNKSDLSKVFHYCTDKTCYCSGQSRISEGSLFNDPNNIMFCWYGSKGSKFTLLYFTFWVKLTYFTFSKQNKDKMPPLHLTILLMKITISAIASIFKKKEILRKKGLIVVVVDSRPSQVNLCRS